MKNITLAKITFLLLLSFNVLATDTFDEISNAIRSGDSHQLSDFFAPTIELTILDQDNIYSKAQAELILKDFFEKNHPKTFSIVHKGSSPEKTQYAIGQLTSAAGKTFRVSFYFKSNQGKNLLQELRIETE